MIYQEMQIPISGLHNIPLDVITFNETNSVDRTFKLSLDQFGFAIMDVTITAQSSSEYCKTRAIIDTGAAYSTLKQDVIERLNLPLLKKGKMMHPIDGIMDINYYLITLQIEDALFEQVQVGVLHQKDYPADLILGVSFLKYCKFTYDALEGNSELHFKM